MIRPYYEDYANHAMRFYARNRSISPNDFSSTVDAVNWAACRDAMETLPTEDRVVALMAYTCRSGMADSVACVSAEYGISENRIWRILNRVTKEFATKRGLI